MRRLIGLTRRRRYMVATLLVVSMGLIWVVAAAADAPDPIDEFDGAFPGRIAATAITTNDCTVAVPCKNENGVNVTSGFQVHTNGGWIWTTHSKDCNLDRAGVGMAIAWFDPDQAGNAVGTFDIDGDGTADAVATGVATANSKNPADNVAHPVPKGYQAQGSPNGGGNVDVTSPALFAQWRGGCGTGAVPSRGDWGQRSLKKSSATTFVTNYDTQSITHIYASRDKFTKLCAVTYDVHGGTNAASGTTVGLGTPGGASNITAGGSSHNADNDLQKNVGAGFQDACIFIPTINTDATSGLPTDSIHDTATLSGGPAAGYDGSLEFRAFDTLAQCQGYPGNGATPFFEDTATWLNGVTGNLDYQSGDIPTPVPPGDYFWKVHYTGDTASRTAATDSVCNNNATHPTEKSVVDKAPTSTDTAQKLTIQEHIRVTGTVGLALTGTATVALYGPSTNGALADCTAANNTATSPAPFEGPTTVTLAGGAGGGGTATADHTVTITPTTSSTFNGHYVWFVRYNGDTNNAASPASGGGCTENFDLSGNVAGLDP